MQENFVTHLICKRSDWRLAGKLSSLTTAEPSCITSERAAAGADARAEHLGSTTSLASAATPAEALQFWKLPGFQRLVQRV